MNKQVSSYELNTPDLRLIMNTTSTKAAEENRADFIQDLREAVFAHRDAPLTREARKDLEMKIQDLIRDLDYF